MGGRKNPLRKSSSYLLLIATLLTSEVLSDCQYVPMTIDEEEEDYFSSYHNWYANFHSNYILHIWNKNLLFGFNLKKQKHGTKTWRKSSLQAFD